MPKFIGEIIQQSGDFALVDSSNLRGGFQQVSTLLDRDRIISDKKKKGMLVYVDETRQLYQWRGDDWIVFRANGNNPDSIINHDVYYTLSQIVDKVDNDSKELHFDKETLFKIDDILGFNIIATKDGNIQGNYIRVADVSTNSIIVEGEQLPEKYDTVYLVGSLSSEERASILAIHPCGENVVLTQFVNDSIDTINTKYTFRLGYDNDSKWNVYGDNVHFKGTFLNKEGKNLNELIKKNTITINTGLTNVRREYEYDNMIVNPYFIDGMDCWHTENSTAFFTLGNKFLMTNGTIFSAKRGGAYVIVEDQNILLRITNGYILQKNEDLRKILNLEGENEVYHVDFLCTYKIVSSGDLRISIENETSDGYREDEQQPVYRAEKHFDEVDNRYYTYKTSFLWNGTGDFRLDYLDGEIKMQALVIRINEVKTFERKYKELLDYSSILVKMAKDYLQQTP